MRIAFYVVMLFIALVSAVDAMTGVAKKTDDSVLKTLGIQVKPRKTESVIVFGISTAALVVMLISEVVL